MRNREQVIWDFVHQCLMLSIHMKILVESR